MPATRQPNGIFRVILSPPFTSLPRSPLMRGWQFYTRYFEGFMTPRSSRLWLLAGMGTTLLASAQTPTTPPAATPAVTTVPASAMPITAPTIAPTDDEMIDGIKLTDATIDHVLM